MDLEGRGLSGRGFVTTVWVGVGRGADWVGCGLGWGRGLDGGGGGALG
ncbi:MAG: hypothetical protein KC917_08435 [Candidatus Omnitrophica bacterium]|nr:hypothetical protein [Candidatus Omnitrophota bacterium]